MFCLNNINPIVSILLISTITLSFVFIYKKIYPIYIAAQNIKGKVYKVWTYTPVGSIYELLTSFQAENRAKEEKLKRKVFIILILLFYLLYK